MIRSVGFVVTNFWMQCFPLLKKIIQKIEAIFRSFLWSGGPEITRKSPISWPKVCSSRKQGGLNLISLYEWNQANLIKLWNFSGKSDRLWIRWIHSYYIQWDEVMIVSVKSMCSWMLKAILKQRDIVQQLGIWNNLQATSVFKTKMIYQSLKESHQEVAWRKLFSGNLARPKAHFILWLACHGRLATKD